MYIPLWDFKGTSVTKKMPYYIVDIIVKNATIQGLFSSDLIFPSDAIYRRFSAKQSPRKSFRSAPTPILTLLEATTNYEIRDFNEQECVSQTRFLASYSRSISSVCRENRTVNELSAYTYGTRYGGSIPASSLGRTFDRSLCFSWDTHFSSSRSFS